jgi:hypothetical protein
MMENKFDALTLLAEGAGCADEVAAENAALAARQADSRLGVAVIGNPNAGKTTVLNKILGRTVREPSALPDEGLPLRVSFVREEEDDAFACVSVFDPAWAGMNMVFYEYGNEQAFPDGMTEPVRAFLKADAAVYVMSAVVPFSSSDARALSMLSGTPAMLVLSKLDMLTPEDREQVIAYVSLSLSEMDLGSVAVTPGDEDVAAAFDEFVSALDMDKARARREQAAFRTAQAKVLARLKEQIEETERADAARAEDNARVDALTHRQELFIERVTEDARTCARTVSERARAELDAAGKARFKVLFEEIKAPAVGEEKRAEKLRDAFARNMEELLAGEAASVEGAMRADVARWRSEMKTDLEVDVALDLASIESMCKATLVASGKYKSYARHWASRGPGIADLALGAGTVAVFLIHQPLIIVPIATAIAYHAATRQKYVSEEWERDAARAWAENCVNMGDVLADAVKNQYGALAEAFADLLRAGMPTRAEAGDGYRIEELRALRQACAALTDKQTKE